MAREREQPQSQPQKQRAAAAHCPPCSMPTRPLRRSFRLTETSERQKQSHHAAVESVVLVLSDDGGACGGGGARCSEDDGSAVGLALITGAPNIILNYWPPCFSPLRPLPLLLYSLSSDKNALSLSLPSLSMHGGLLDALNHTHSTVQWRTFHPISKSYIVRRTYIVGSQAAEVGFCYGLL